MVLWEQALVIFLLVMTVLVILLIPTVVSLFKTLSKFSKTLDELNKELPAIMQDVADITDNTASATTKLNGAVDDIVEFEQKLSSELKEPALEAVATLVGVLKGLQTFMTFIIKKK
jgi:uncharacterized protein YoxC